MKLVKKYAKKASKHVSRKTKAAAKAVRGLTAAGAEKVASYATRKVLLSVAALALSALPANLAVKQYHSRMYAKGCVDGAAIGLAVLTGSIMENREEVFGKICTELGQNHAQGKSLEDLLNK